MVSIRISIFIIAHDREKTIGSTILILKKELDIEPKIFVVDNGSTDRTSEISTRLGATLIRYRVHQKRDIVIRKAIERGYEQDSDIVFFLDIAGGNTPDDVISLYFKGKRLKRKVALGYIQPYKGTDTIGCFAMDKKMMMNVLERRGDIVEIIRDMESSSEFDKHKIYDTMEIKGKKRKITNSSLSKRIKKKAKYFRRNHPLQFYGLMGSLFFLGSMLSTYYTVDYFYKNQHLAYLPAFITVVLVMISGFFFITGLMINAFNTLIERLERLNDWIR